MPEIVEGLLESGASHSKPPQSSLQVTGESNLEETCHLSDVEGRKHAACDGGGVWGGRKNTITKLKISRQYFKVDNLKIYSISSHLLHNPELSGEKRQVT